MTNETQTPTQEATDAWRAALASRRTEVANPEAIPAAAVSRREPDTSRRNFIRLSFWGGLGTTLLGSVGLALDFLYPRLLKVIDATPHDFIPHVALRLREIRAGG